MLLPPSYPLAQLEARRDAIEAAIRRTLDSGRYVLGPEMAAFEAAFAEYVGVRHGVGVNSGTDAIALALQALGIGAGDEVVTTSFTAVATVAAIELAGATPVLVDVERRFRTMAPEALEAAITERTRAVVVVHLYGQAADLETILAIARRRGLAVIEDCAQCAGATWRGRRLGSFGDAACFSFYPTKNLGALGDGGMLLTSREEVAAAGRALREYGWSRERVSERPGRNSRLDEIQAAILSAKLPHLDEDNERRRALAARYGQRLAALGVTPPTEREQGGHVFHLYVVEVEDRSAHLDALRRHGVLGGVHYPTPVHREPAYAGRLATPGGMAVTEALCGRILTLPMYPELDPSVVDRVCAAFEEVGR